MKEFKPKLIYSCLLYMHIYTQPMHLNGDVLYIEMAGCSAEVSGVQSTSGFMVADHAGFVQLGSSCHDQLTLV